MTSTETNLKRKTARLEARLDPEQKELIQRAADIEGISFTDYVLSKLHLAAEETIMRHNVVSLTAEGSAAFVESLLNPAGPNEALREAYAEYRQFTHE